MLKHLATRLRITKPAVSSTERLHLTLKPQQVLHDRYKVLSRLGQGQEATVWLAEEIAPAKKQVAVKVLTDYVTLIQEKHAFELRVMQRISKIPPTHPAFSGTRNLLPLFDHFTYPGVRGDHLCLVTELLGPDLYDITTTKTDKRAALPLDLVKHVTRQLLQALTTLHEGCQTVHTDIKQSNILFKRSAFTTDGKINGARLFDQDNVVLIDYGTAMPLDAMRDRLIQPDALRSPEVLLGCQWGVKTDIWNLGCIVFELLTSRNLFGHVPIGDFPADQHHIARILASLTDDAEYDRLQPYFQTGRKYDEFFNRNDGSLKLSIASDCRESLEKITNIYGVYTPELVEFLTAMLRVHPDDRPSARELQTFAWLRR